LEAPTFLYSSFRRASIRMGIKGTKMKASMAPRMMKPERVRWILVSGSPSSFEGP
jgi:hypothetical protein